MWKKGEAVRRFLWQFYNDLGLRFDIDGKPDLKPLWPPKLWLLSCYLWNSGLARKSKLLYSVHRWASSRIMPGYVNKTTYLEVRNESTVCEPG